MGEIVGWTLALVGNQSKKDNSKFSTVLGMEHAMPSRKKTCHGNHRSNTQHAERFRPILLGLVKVASLSLYNMYEIFEVRGYKNENIFHAT